MTNLDSELKKLTMTVDARPGPIEVETARTAVVVVDMQNDFGSKGGMFDRAGIDLSGIRAAINPIAKVIASARSLSIPIVYIKMGFREDLSDLGEPGSPNRERHLLYGVGGSTIAEGGREGRTLIRDTWNTDVIPELKPEPDDVLVYKHRFSGFYQTELDAVLKQLGVRYVIVTGCTTSVCVESTVRDACFRDYSCILLADCTAEPIGPGAAGYRLMAGGGTGAAVSNHEATLFLVETLFGWVSDSKAVISAFEKRAIGAMRA